MMAGEPVRHHRMYDVESFLVEARSLTGYSGSPVFCVIPPLSFRGKMDNPDGLFSPANVTSYFLLGIDWGHVEMKSPVRDAADRRLDSGEYVSLNSGIM